jgi:hypothetical protein
MMPMAGQSTGKAMKYLGLFVLGLIAYFILSSLFPPVRTFNNQIVKTVIDFFGGKF